MVVALPTEPPSSSVGPTRQVLSTRGVSNASRHPLRYSNELEVPYALPPTRFADPVPLPPDYKYEAKEYIFESKCTSYLVVTSHTN